VFARVGRSRDLGCAGLVLSGAAGAGVEVRRLDVTNDRMKVRPLRGRSIFSLTRALFCGWRVPPKYVPKSVQS